MASSPASISTSTNESGPSSAPSTRRRSLFFSRQFSNASLLTIGSVNTILPQYSAVGDDERSQNAPGIDNSADGVQYYASPPLSEPSGSVPTSPLSPPGSPILPSRLSVINPRHSTLLAWTTSESTPISRGLARADPCFQYSFPISSNKHWATLILSTRREIAGNSRPSQTQPKLPRFWGCDPVTGVVQLDIENPLTIQQINVTLRGKLLTSSHDGGSLQFMSHQVTLWKKSFGNPPQPDMNADSPNQKYDGRFTGKYSFSFSFPFPTHVDPTTKLAVLPPHDSTSPPEPPPTRPMLPTPSSPTDSPGTMKGKKKRFSWPLNFGSGSSGSGGSGTSFSPPSKPPITVSPLPQTFSEKGVNAVIIYDILINFVHGRFKPDSRIKSQITYIPASQPLPASPNRRQAYEAGALTPGPIADPDGWFALPTASIRGVIDVDGERRSTVIDCTLYLAQPLSYTRCGVIPCFLTLSSEDAEALSWLSSPSVPVVRLMRCLRHFVSSIEDPYEGRVIDTWSPPSTLMIVPGDAVINKKLDLKTVIHEMATATWWIPSKDVVQQENVRHLEGEIHLDVDLQPSCANKIFNIEYTVELVSLQSTCFNSDMEQASGLGKGRSTEDAVASLPVEIATLYRQDEPVPIPYTERPKARIRRVPSHDTVWEQDENV